MAGRNCWNGIGNLGKDPEQRFTKDGTEISRFSMACTEVYYNNNHEKVERTEWVNVVVWDKLAGICNRWLHKGRQVFVEGRMQTSDWVDKDGVKRYTTEIVARDVQFLGGNPNAAGRGGEGYHEPDPDPGGEFGPPLDMDNP